MAVVLIAAHIGRRAASCFVDVALRVIRIPDSILARVNFVMLLDVEIQRVQLYDILAVMRHRPMAFRRTLHWGLHCSETDM